MRQLKGVKHMAENKLRGKIYAKFRTLSEFAEACGTTTATASRKLSGKVQWKHKEVSMICKLLDIPMDEADQYFF